MTFNNFHAFINGYPRDGFVGSIPLPRYVFLPNETQLLWANYFRTVIPNLSRAYSEVQRSDPIEFVGLPSLSTPLALPFYKNIFGKIMICILVHDSSLRYHEANGTLAATKIIIASHLFERTTGRRPQTLDELVPDFLPSVPLDPFDGQPFRYNPDKGVIYSVGTSLKDLGGLPFFPDTEPSESQLERIKDNPWKGDNAVFHIWE